MSCNCSVCNKKLPNEWARVFHEDTHSEGECYNKNKPHKYSNYIGYDICRFCERPYDDKVHLKQYAKNYPHEKIEVIQ